MLTVWLWSESVDQIRSVFFFILFFSTQIFMVTKLHHYKLRENTQLIGQICVGREQNMKHRKKVLCS